MNIGTQFFYIWLVGFIAFVVWRIKTNPIAQIHEAVLDGNINLVRQCLEKGVNVDFRQNAGISPLCVAAMKNQPEIAELLISYGADVNQGLNEEHGVNPLLAATIGNYSELADMLVSKGAKSGLHLAALRGDIDAVKSFLEQQIFLINSTRNRGMTPLHLAAIGGHRQVVELLLTSSATIDFFTSASQTPLYQAAKFNQLEVVDLLIDRGADPNLALALYVATKQNYPELVKLLIAKGVDINYQSGATDTPLHTAAKLGLIEIVQVLLSNGAKANIKNKYEGSTPLHKASGEGHLQVVKLLVDNGAEVNSINNFLRTPLDYAINYKHKEVIEWLKHKDAVGQGFFD
jgi:ankyrin repeat protein